MKTRLNITIDADQLKRAIFPKTVPILSANDFVKKSAEKDGRMCLHRRIGYVFSDKICSNDNPFVARNIIEEIMTEVIYDEVKSDKYAFNIVAFNDTGDTTLADLARVWNRTMAAAGYTEGNPAASTIEPIPALA